MFAYFEFFSRSASAPIGQNTQKGSTTSTFPSGAGITQTPGGTQQTTITIASSNGVIQTRDFKSDPTTVADPINHGQFYLGYHFSEGRWDTTATDNPPYIIDYVDSSQYFIVTLLQEPIRQTRLQAQQYITVHLGITEDQICQLKYTVNVPGWVNANYAGTNLGFSFCSGAVQLP